MSEPREVTDAMIEAARRVLAEEWQPPYMARAEDYLRDDRSRAESLAALQAADREADRLTRESIRRALVAALAAPVDLAVWEPSSNLEPPF